MVQLADREWHATGGHREPEESAEQAAIRETREEGGCPADELVPIGVRRVTVLGDQPESWRYPSPVSYQVFFSGRVLPGKPCAGTEELKRPSSTRQMQARPTGFSGCEPCTTPPSGSRPISLEPIRRRTLLRRRQSHRHVAHGGPIHSQRRRRTRLGSDDRQLAKDCTPDPGCSKRFDPRTTSPSMTFCNA